MFTVKKIDSTNETVSKFIFEKADAIAEAVLYTYNSAQERTVICCSVMSGCPVGCTFCGTGAKFIRNLTADEIVFQVKEIVSNVDPNLNSSCEKFQIMFMSMGEPMLNWDNTLKAIDELSTLYPNAQLLISTIGVADKAVMDEMILASICNEQIGLQFSIHAATDSYRDSLIPFKNKLTLQGIRDFGIMWGKETGRKVYLNYCVSEANATRYNAEELMKLFSPIIFNFTFSVICSADETMKDAGERNLETIRDFENIFARAGYNTRIFDPAGQDDIGGGCGQLWHVQNWMKRSGK